MNESTILLVEDNPDDVELTLRALRKSEVRCQVDVATDGAAALDYLLGQPERPLPAFVLLDLKLPKVSGHEVLARIRSEPRTRLLPVVILTSSRERQDLERCYALGANSYVRKPVDSDAFMSAARQLGVYWLEVNERLAPEGGL
ncbi:MAG TPA: response regulator [Vicinamibacteria bacterium]